MSKANANNDSHMADNTDAGDPVPFKNWIAVIGTAVGAFMAILDIQITASSLRDIQGGLGASVDEGSWISTSYLIAEIVTIPLTGWLSRVFGARSYIVANAILFVIFSILCGMAHDMPTMIVFRALQGFTGGTLIPMCFSTILEMLPPSKQPIGLAIFSLSATFAPSIGPAVGGYITDTFSWPYIFFLNVIPGLILIAMLVYSLPASNMQIDLLKKHDVPGIILMSVGLSCLIYVLEEGQRKDWFGSDLIRTPAIIAAITLTLFVIRELLARYPLVNLRLLMRRNFWIWNFIHHRARLCSLWFCVFAASLPRNCSRLQRLANRSSSNLVRTTSTFVHSLHSSSDEKDRPTMDGIVRTDHVRNQLFNERLHEP
jgi:drug resistance transporter, EmrB/QacA subfamily